MIGIVTIDPRGIILHANHRFLALIGRDEVGDHASIWQWLGPSQWYDSPDRALAELRRARTGEPLEVELLRVDGSTVPVTLELAPPSPDTNRRQVDEPSDGRDERYVLIVVDRSRTAELEREVAWLEQYKALVDNHPVPIFVKEYSDERDGVYTIVNPVCLEVTGIDRIVGRSDRDFLPPAVAESLRAHDRMVLASGKPVIAEEQTPDARSGKIIDVISVKIPLIDKSGRAIRIAGMTTDITAQKQLTRRLAALVDALPDMMYRISADGTFLDFKNNRDGTLGMSVSAASASSAASPAAPQPDDIVGQNIEDTTLPSSVKRATLAAIERALASDEVQEIEYNVETSLGIRHVEARLTRSDTDEVVAIVRDITKATETRAALLQTNAELQMANNELRQFAYAASHDLQEPLRTVRSFVELLEERYRDSFDERGRKWLGYVVTGAQRMRDLIDDLLTYSQTGQSRQITDVDTARLVGEVIEDLGSIVVSQNARFNIGPLPRVLVCEVELRQVFQNLISNALKFRRPDVDPEISIAAQENDGRWVFSVADNGIGIDHADQDRIFQMFHRLHPRDRYGGTGIGLALVKKIIDTWNGTIVVHSTPGQGSVFQFMLGSERRSLLDAD